MSAPPGPAIARSLLLDARLPGLSGSFDISVEDGVVVGVSESTADSASDGTVSQDLAIIDLRGHLLVPSLQEHHSHLDKALTAQAIPNPSGDLMGAIEAWIRAEEIGVLGFDEMRARAESSLEQLVLSGVTKVRTHVNVGGSDPNLRNLRAVDAARREFSQLIEVEIVALLHSPLCGDEGRLNRTALEKAIEFGVDLVGGCPHLEEDSEGMIDLVLEAAQAADLPLDLHVDETLDSNMLTIEYLAKTVLKRQFTGSVSASHCVSLATQPISHQERLADLLREARITVVALPQTNLFLQGRDHPQSMPRGITPVALLKERGVKVVAGGDNVQDPFNPMGRNDPLETASLLVTAAHLPADDAFEAVATRPLSVGERGTALVGRSADFLALDAGSVREALATGTSTRRTIRSGRLISESVVERRVIRNA